MTKKEKRVWSSPSRIALIYAGIGLLWLFFSDRLTEVIIPAGLRQQAHLFKGFLYVAVTSLILYALWRSCITTLRHLYQGTADSEEKYRTYYERGPVPCFSLNEENCILETNPALQMVTGFDAKELLGISFEKLLHPEDVNRFSDNFIDFRQRGFLHNAEYRLRRKDDSYIVINFEGSIERDSGGAFREAYCSFSDVTAEKRHLKMLRESNMRLNHAQQVAHMGTWEADLKTRQCALSEIASEIFGIEEAIIPLKTYSTLEVEEDGRIEEWLNQVIAGESPEELICQIRRPDNGELRWVHFSAELIKGEQGENDSLIGVAIDVTSLRAIEETMLESEFLHREIFDHVSCGIAIYQPENDGEQFIIHNLNPFGAQTSDVEISNVVGREVTEVFPGVKEMGLLEVFQRVYSSGIAEFYPVRRYEDQRVEMWVENYVFRLQSGHVVAVYNDVTNRKRMEDELRSERDLFTQMFENSPYVQVLVNSNGEVENINRAGITTTGNSKEMAIHGMTGQVLNCINTHNGETCGQGETCKKCPIRTRIDRTFATEEGIQGEADTFACSDGSGQIQDVHFQISTSLITFQHQEMVLLSLLDISSQERSKSRLKHLNEVQLCIRDVDRLITHEKSRSHLIERACEILVEDRGFSHAWIALLEDDTGELLDFSESGTPDSHGQLEALIREKRIPHCVLDTKREKCLTITEDPSSECPHCPLSNRYEGQAVVCLPLAHNESCYGYLSATIKRNAIHDQEELSLLAEIAKDLAFAINSIDLEEHREKSVKDLLQAKEEAEAASRAKDEFLTVMSHEMRTPLNPILGFANLMLDDAEDPEREYLETIVDSCEQQMELIDNVLNYTRLDRKHLEPIITEFNLAEACVSALTEFSKKQPQLQLHFNNGFVDYEAISQDLFVRGDKEIFLDILFQLLGNACKFTDEGSISLLAGISRSEKCAEGKQMFWFAVRDTGIGLSHDMFRDLFNPFPATKTTGLRRYQGAGLGLAVCRKRVEILGGQIGAAGEPGAGSTFWFKLPLEPCSNLAPQRDVESTGLGRLPRKIQVLIVEDKPDNARIAQIFVETFGALAFLAGNGAEAVEACRKKRFDAILMDLSMPVMSGVEATESIRGSDNPNRETPIVALTAHVNSETRTKCLHHGMSAYLGKPIEPSALFEVLDEIARGETSKR